MQTVLCQPSEYIYPKLPLDSQIVSEILLLVLYFFTSLFRRKR